MGLGLAYSLFGFSAYAINQITESQFDIIAPEGIWTVSKESQSLPEAFKEVGPLTPRIVLHVGGRFFGHVFSLLSTDYMKSHIDTR